MSIPKLAFGQAHDTTSAALDLDHLISSRLLVQANSGGGKSRLLRSLAEQTHGNVQQIILDPEGEFASLREQFPYLLVGGAEADIPAHPDTARSLCRKLVELEVSTVIDLYDLKLPLRRKFVRLFLAFRREAPRSTCTQVSGGMKGA